MKTKIHPKKISPILWVFIPIIVAVVLCGYYIWQYKLNKVEPVNNTGIDQTIDLNPPTSEQKAAGETQKNETSTPTNNDLGISITSINSSDDPVQIRSVISGAVSNAGTCVLSLSKGSSLITINSGTYAMPSSSTCMGFDINRSDLSIGQWQLTLTVSIDGTESSLTDRFSLD